MLLEQFDEPLLAQNSFLVGCALAREAYALACETDATLYISGEGGPDRQYAFAHAPGVHVVRDGDAIRAGHVRPDVIPTPGHTPEHLTSLVTDEAAGPAPYAALTGDFIVAGDVGRPDLQEKAVGQAGSADAAARHLFASLRAFAGRADGLLLFPGHGAAFPGHGAASSWRKHLGGLPATSVG